MKWEINWLKNNCKMIHYFGLGFIQLKIDENMRVHFYTAKLPPIVPEEDVHNHRYNFNSRVVLGAFSQEIYEVVEGDTHLLENESCKVGVEADGCSKLCGLRLSCVHDYVAGSEYWISHETFHRVLTKGDCITSLRRSDYKKEFAQVIRPVGEKAVCPFSKTVPEGELWEIVESMVKQVSM